MQRRRLLCPSVICMLKCCFQQLLQKVCPHSMVLAALHSTSQKHVPQDTEASVPRSKRTALNWPSDGPVGIDRCSVAQGPCNNASHSHADQGTTGAAPPCSVGSSSECDVTLATRKACSCPLSASRPAITTRISGISSACLAEHHHTTRCPSPQKPFDRFMLQHLYDRKCHHQRMPLCPIGSR